LASSLPPLAGVDRCRSRSACLPLPSLLPTPLPFSKLSRFPSQVRGQTRGRADIRPISSHSNPLPRQVPLSSLSRLSVSRFLETREDPFPPPSIPESRFSKGWVFSPFPLFISSLGSSLVPTYVRCICPLLFSPVKCRLFPSRVLLLSSLRLLPFFPAIPAIHSPLRHLSCHLLLFVLIEYLLSPSSFSFDDVRVRYFLSPSAILTSVMISVLLWNRDFFSCFPRTPP